MNEKIKRLIRKGSNDELLAYLSARRYRTRFDELYEKLLIDRCSKEVVLAYINRFSLSLDAEKYLVEKMPADVCVKYYNLQGFYNETEMHIIDNNLVDVARELFKCNFFNDSQYILGCQKDDIIMAFIESCKELDEKEVMYLLDHRNRSILVKYIKRGFVLSQKVKEEIIRKDNIQAFRALCEHYNHIYRIRVSHMHDFRQIMGQIEAYALTPDLQIEVLKNAGSMMVEVMLSLMPLCYEAQEYIVNDRLAKPLLKKHVECMYCLGGYRFEKDFESKLFFALSKNNLDECLMSYKYHDHLAIVNNASVGALVNYVKNVWLWDTAQVALIYRGEEVAIREFISRCSFDRGLCWEAEVALAHLNNERLLEMYINIHTMCEEAVRILCKTNQKLHQMYCAKYAK